MHSFQGIWALLKPQGEYKRRRQACERLWASYDALTQDRIYETIRVALEQGQWVSPNPYFAIEDVVVKAQRISRPQTITADEYYRRYRTQANQDGWERTFLPQEQKTIYVKKG